MSKEGEEDRGPGHGGGAHTLLLSPGGTEHHKVSYLLPSGEGREDPSCKLFPPPGSLGIKLVKAEWRWGTRASRGGDPGTSQLLVPSEHRAEGTGLRPCFPS